MKRFSQKTALLQWLDRYLGVFLCGVFTAARNLAELFSKSAEPAGYHSVLFVKLTEQGSTVLAYDALSRAVARVGREHVYMLVFEENRFIVDLLAIIPEENVLTVKTTSWWSMVISFISQLGAIRRRKIDACVDLEFFSRSSAAIAWLTGAGCRVGFYSSSSAGPNRGDLFTHRVCFDVKQHTSSAFVRLVRTLESEPVNGSEIHNPASEILAQPRFMPTVEERQAMEAVVRRLGATADSPLILLNANAGDLLPMRKWAGGNYVALARRLIEEVPGCLVLFTGSPDETAETSALVERVASAQCRSLAGHTTLRELVTLYTLADVLVTNDSGPAHFAALTEIEVVVLFGPETPVLFAANTPRNHVIWAAVPCSPCVNAYNNRQTVCKNNLCMQSISVEQVYGSVERLCQKYRIAVG